MLTSTPKAETTRADLVRVVTLGLNASIVSVIIPWMFEKPQTVASTILMVIAPLCVLSGAAMLGRRPRAAALALLFAAPATLALGHAAATPAPMFATTLIAAAALVAYLSGASIGVMRPIVLREIEYRPIAVQPPSRSATRRRAMQTSVLAVIAVPLFVLLVWAPLASDDVRVRSEARLLTAIAACAIACGSLAVFAGPAFRARRTPRRRGQPWLLWVSLATAALFATTFLLTKL